MELFRSRWVTCLPENFPIQQTDSLFLKGKLFNFILKNYPVYCWLRKFSGKPVTPLYLESSMGQPSKTYVDCKFAILEHQNLCETWKLIFIVNHSLKFVAKAINSRSICIPKIKITGILKGPGRNHRDRNPYRLDGYARTLFSPIINFYLLRLPLCVDEAVIMCWWSCRYVLMKLNVCVSWSTSKLLHWKH